MPAPSSQRIAWHVTDSADRQSHALSGKQQCFKQPNRAHALCGTPGTEICLGWSDYRSATLNTGVRTPTTDAEILPRLKLMYKLIGFLSNGTNNVAKSDAMTLLIGLKWQWSMIQLYTIFFGAGAMLIHFVSWCPFLFFWSVWGLCLLFPSNTNPLMECLGPVRWLLDNMLHDS